jgi:hypothetical protein
MNALRDLVIENPMLIEIRRFRSRMLSSRSGGANIAVVILILFFYACIVLTVLMAREDLDPMWIIMFQTGLFSLLLPIMVAGSIAGERERRTWDILIAAPVSKAQIVVGKFIVSLTGLAIFFVACLVPIVVCLICNKTAKLSLTLIEEMVSASFGVLLISFSLLVSARCRTTFAALGACVGVIFIVLLAFPIFVTSVLRDGGRIVLEAISPFMIINGVYEHSTGSGYYDSEQDRHFLLWNAPYLVTAIYLSLAAIMLLWATLTVRKMEEIKNTMSESEGKGVKARA